MNPASGNRAEGAKNEAEIVDVGFACDRIERQEFARYEAIEVCEVERNSPLLFPLGEGAKNEAESVDFGRTTEREMIDFARYEARSTTAERGEIRRL